MQTRPSHPYRHLVVLILVIALFALFAALAPRLARGDEGVAGATVAAPSWSTSQCPAATGPRG